MRQDGRAARQFDHIACNGCMECAIIYQKRTERMVETNKVIKAVIFDLEGVVVRTKDCRLRAWRQTAQEQGILLDEKIEKKIAELSASEALNTILTRSRRVYSPAEKLALTARQSDLFDEELTRAQEYLAVDDTIGMVQALRDAGVKVAAVSGEGMARALLSRLKIRHLFDSIVDGGNGQELLKEAADRLQVQTSECMLVSCDEKLMNGAAKCGMQCDDTALQKCEEVRKENLYRSNWEVTNA